MKEQTLSPAERCPALSVDSRPLGVLDIRDTSIVHVHQHSACIIRDRRQSMERSRGGLISKIHAVVDTNGLPVRLALTAGEAHDNRLGGRLLSRLKSGTMLLADRGYDADLGQSSCSPAQRLGEYPTKRTRTETLCFSPYVYRARNLVERFFNKIKDCRRVATRYDKPAANYLAFVQLASIGLGCALVSPRASAGFGRTEEA
jgi:transposase